MLFPGPLPTPTPPDPDRAVLLRRPLRERLLETMRYLAEEIEPREVGGLGEAQAAGYIAGRLRRVEQQAVVLSFRSDAPAWVTLLLMVLGVVVALAVPLVMPPSLIRFASGASAALLAVVCGLFWNEAAGAGALSQLVGRRISQSVVAVRAATSTGGPRQRVVLVAPLDGPPSSPSRRVAQLTLALLAITCLVHLATVISPRWSWPLPLMLASMLSVIMLVIMIDQHRRSDVQPGVLGAGELAALVGVAEEIGTLEQTEVWAIAAGAGLAGDASLRQVFRRYPFDTATAVVNLDRITSGPPVYATREGVLRERRSDRRLLALTSTADAHDSRINAEPRPLARRTLANLPLQRHLAAITITSQPDQTGFISPDQTTIERCVLLVVGLLREIDREGLTAAD